MLRFAVHVFYGTIWRIPRADMHPLKSSPRNMAPTVIAIGITQIIGWGATFNLPGVIGTSIADDFNSSLDVVLFGPTVMLTILGIVSWWIAPLFERFGTRILMTAGALIMAVGLLMMALAPTVHLFLFAWVFFGLGGAASLSTAAQILLADIFGDRARQAIGAMSLVSGLSNTILWPVISRIDNALGWRMVIVVAAMSMVMIYIPIVLKFGAPNPRTRHGIVEGSASEPQQLDPLLFTLLAGVTALNGFITWGFSLTLIPLLIQKGLENSQAVTLASLLGVFSIAARSFDTLGGWSPLRSAIVATSTMLSAFLLMYFGGSFILAAIFVLLYGLASGLLSVVRATLPLTIFPAKAYAHAAVRLAMPMNLAFAAAPPVFARILEQQSANSALVLSIILSAAALACLAALTILVRRREEASFE